MAASDILDKPIHPAPPRVVGARFVTRGPCLCCGSGGIRCVDESHAALWQAAFRVERGGAEPFQWVYFQSAAAIVKGTLWAPDRSIIRSLVDLSRIAYTDHSIQSVAHADDAAKAFREFVESDLKARCQAPVDVTWRPEAR